MEHKGAVYSFTGPSGVGKTIVDSLLYQRLKNTKPNAVYLDRDEVWVAFGKDVGYANDDRLRWAGRIFRVCRLLSDQDIDMVYCFIAMFDTVCCWNREYIPNYREVYVRVKKETPIQRNQKGLCTEGRNVVGADLPFDEPRSPDLILQNDREYTPLELAEEIEGILCPNIVEHPIDNTDYWNLYYRNKLCPTNLSLFARYVSTLVEPGRVLAELGCGNGRDVPYFASLGLDVVTMNLSKTVIGILRQQSIPHARFVCDDLISHTLHQPESYDYAYSRSTIHAISQKQEQILPGGMAWALKSGGEFSIEVRSVHGPLCGKGEALERSAFFYDNHYHRFLMLNELIEALRQAGFRIEYTREQIDFVPYGNDGPPVIRVMAVEG